jgi:hypothetical protein
MQPVTRELIPAVTALCAVVLSPIVSIYVVRKQFAAQVLSGNRQEWINALRSELAELTSLIGYIPYWRRTDKGTDEQQLLLYREVYLHWAKIALLANPGEDDHKKLLELVDKAVVACESPPACSGHEVRQAVDQVVAQAQAVLKREWKRVKKGA